MHIAIKELFDNYINEELTPSQKKKVDTWKKGDNSFSDHAFEEGKDRITHPLESPSSPQSEHLPKIEQHLSQHGFKVKDYTAGKATDKYGREVNIGKALNKTGASDELKKGFESDPTRGQARTGSSNLQMTLTRRPHDVAGMTSKGHSWEQESCMNFVNGCHKDYLPADVKHGTHVAYLHHKDDPEMKRPLARIALKKYTNIEDENDHILRPENRTYGNAPDAFSHTVNRWVNRNFPGKPDAIYKKNEEVYDDTGNNYVIGEHALDKAVVHPLTAIRREAATNPRLTTKHLDTLMKDNNENISRIALRNPNINSSHVETAFHRGIYGSASHPKASNKLLTNILTKKDDDGDHVYDEWTRAEAASNPSATKAHLDAAVNDPSQMVKNYAARNSRLGSSHISRLLNDSSESVRASAANNPNLSSRHIDRSLSRELQPRGSSTVIVNLARHKKFNSSHINRVFDDQNSTNDVKRYAIRNSNASAANIAKALKDPDVRVREDAIMHPNANSSHISKALKDTSEDVRTRAVDHPNFGAEHITQTLNLSQPLHIRAKAAKHPAATPSQISKALKDRHMGVRLAALRNPNATTDHIEKGINDEEDHIRTQAISHPNATFDQIKRVASGPSDRYSTGEAKSLLSKLIKKKRK